MLWFRKTKQRLVSFDTQKEVVMSNMKRWLRDQGISYSSIAAAMDQTKSSICQKVNLKAQWQKKDFLYLHDHYGLSADFVLDLIPYDCNEKAEGRPEKMSLV